MADEQHGCRRRAFLCLFIAALAWLCTAVLPSIAQTSRFLEFLTSMALADLIPGAYRSARHRAHRRSRRLMQASSTLVTPT